MSRNVGYIKDDVRLHCGMVKMGGVRKRRHE